MGIQKYAVLAECTRDNSLCIETFDSYGDAWTFKCGMECTKRFNKVEIYSRNEPSL